jgi:RNA polymerase sigma-70 factor (ECF subfamily)
VSHADGTDPEYQALPADSVGLALLVVLDTLAPAERLAFVLHDMFAVPFDEIAPILERSPAATRQLASRARRRVQKADPPPGADVTRQREIVHAWIAASRNGDFDALLALLDPDVVLRVDLGAAPAGATKVVRGARAVVGRARAFGESAQFARPAVVNGSAGIVTAPEGHARSAIAFTIRHGKITEIDLFADPERLAQLDLSALD